MRLRTGLNSFVFIIFVGAALAQSGPTSVPGVNQVKSSEQPVQSGEQVLSIDGIQPIQGIAPAEQLGSARQGAAKKSKRATTLAGAAQVTPQPGLCFAEGYGYLTSSDPRCKLGAAQNGPEQTSDFLNGYLQNPTSGAATAVNTAIANSGSTSSALSSSDTQQNGYNPFGPGISSLGANNNATDCTGRFGCKPKLMPLPGAQTAQTQKANSLDLASGKQRYRIGQYSFKISHKALVMIDEECREVLDLLGSSASARAELTIALTDSSVAQSTKARRLAERYPDRVALKQLERRCQTEMANAMRADKGR